MFKKLTILGVAICILGLIGCNNLKAAVITLEQHGTNDKKITTTYDDFEIEFLKAGFEKKLIKSEIVVNKNTAYLILYFEDDSIFSYPLNKNNLNFPARNVVVV